MSLHPFSCSVQLGLFTPPRFYGVFKSTQVNFLLFFDEFRWLTVSPSCEGWVSWPKNHYQSNIYYIAILSQYLKFSIYIMRTHLLCLSSGSASFAGPGLCSLWRRVLQRDLVNLSAVVNWDGLVFGAFPGCITGCFTLMSWFLATKDNSGASSKMREKKEHLNWDSLHEVLQMLLWRMQTLNWDTATVTWEMFRFWLLTFIIYM